MSPAQGLKSVQAPGSELEAGSEPGRGKTHSGSRKLYSEIFDRREAIIEPPLEIKDESGGRYRLVSTGIEEVPITGRRKKLAGQVIYEEVNRGQAVPETAEMEVMDEESGQAFTAKLGLYRAEYVNERWKGDLSFIVTFHSYGADYYRLGDVKVPHSAEKPQLEDCRTELLAAAGLSEEDCRIEGCSWSGEAYADENGVLCRDAEASGMRRVFDCRAVYSGMTALPDYHKYRLTAEYEKVEKVKRQEENVWKESGEGTVEADEGGLAPVPEQETLPAWLLWLKRGLTVSIGLFLIAAAILAFAWLRKKASELEKGE